MARKKGSEASERLLTEAELELMTILWNLGEATVKDVIAALPPERMLAYTSVATMLKILEQKQYLTCRKDTFAHRFVPIVTKASYESACLDQIVRKVFDGEAVALVQRLLDAKGLGSNELKAIERAVKALSQAGKKRRSTP